MILLFAAGPPVLFGLPDHTFTTMLLLVAVAGDAHGALLVITTETDCPLVNVGIVTVLLVVDAP